MSLEGDTTLPPCETCSHGGSMDNYTMNGTLLTVTAAADIRQTQDNQVINFVFEQVLEPAICVSGVIGNAICIVIFSRQRLRRRVECQEKVVLAGLLSMAFADLLFCFSLLPRTFMHDKDVLVRSGSFKLFYQLYSNGFLTTFSLMSTWLVVNTAGIRYLGICHPLRARYLMGSKGIYIPISIITCASVLANLPAFWMYQTLPLSKGFEVMDLGPFSHVHTRGVVFLLFRNSIGVFLPAILLIYFNTRLLLQLSASDKLQNAVLPNRESSIRSASQQVVRVRLTRTLVAVVAMFIILVYPCELMDFVIFLKASAIHNTEAFLIARLVANLLQVCNFSFNFILYCILSEPFRKTLRDIFSNLFRRRLGSNGVHVSRRPLPPTKEQSTLSESLL